MCSWLVDQTWRKNIQNKVKNDKNNSIDKKTLVCKTLKILHHQTEEREFVVMAVAFLEEMNDDPGTQEFGTYFKTQYMNQAYE